MAYVIPDTLKDKLTTAQALHDLANRLKAKTDELEAAIEESKQGGELNKINRITFNGSAPTPDATNKNVELEIQKNKTKITPTMSGNKVTVNIDLSEYATNDDVVAKLSAVYKPAGSVAFSGLPSTLNDSVLGNVYNVTNEFTTNANFVEGANKKHPAGTNVVVVKDGTTYKFDVLAGFVDLSGYALKTEIPTMPEVPDVSGFVTGPASATDGNIAVFDKTTGKLIKDGGATIASLKHPTGGSAQSGFKKLTSDANGHVTGGSAVTAQDIRDVAGINFDGTNAGLVPVDGVAATKFLRGDGTWQVPTNTTYNVVSTAANGLAPKIAAGCNTKDYALTGDGNWTRLPEIASKDEVDGMLTGIFGA